MKSIKSLLIVLISFSVACNSVSENKIEVVSPDGNIQINFELTIEGVPTYTVSHKKSEVIKSSKLGFDFENASAIFSEFFAALSSTIGGGALVACAGGLGAACFCLLFKLLFLGVLPFAIT